MLLYANGDSHLAATYKYPGDEHPILDQYEMSFAGLLAKRHGLDYINESVAGCSNNRIIRTSKEFLKDKDPENTLVLIGWSTFERTEWYIDGVWHQICGESMYEYNFREELHPPGFDKEFWSKNGDAWKTLSYMWNTYRSRIMESDSSSNNGNTLYQSRAIEAQYYIKEFSEWLSERDFKHLFMHLSGQFWVVPLFENNWNNDVWLFNNPYDPEISFTNKSEFLGHTPDQHYHFSPEAHKDYATFIEQEFINKLLR